MKVLFQIAVEVNSGAVGRVDELIGEAAIRNGWESYIAYARGYRPSKSHTIRIGNWLGIHWHAISTRLFDNHCNCSIVATKHLIKKISMIRPDVIILHHIHGYYINMGILFEYLRISKIPVIWVFHDFWAITGHCAHFTAADCYRWKEMCYDCPQKKVYPASYFLDRSKQNFYNKKRIFTSLPSSQLTIITVSKWMADFIGQSFMNQYNILTIHNAVNCNIFKQVSGLDELRNTLRIGNKKVVLGSATTWTEMKGFSEFFVLANLLPKDYIIILVGLKPSQFRFLPANVIGLERTENVETLVKLYNIADVHVSLSVEETFGLTIIESLACGTPVVAYNVAALKETVTSSVGTLVPLHNVQSVSDAVQHIIGLGKERFTDSCRKYVLSNYSDEKVMGEYIVLANRLLK